MDPMMMMMLMNQMGSDSDDPNSLMSNPMLMMSLLGGGGMGGPGGGINPMMMLMMANMGQDGEADPALEEYLTKSWEKGKRNLSIGVNLNRQPLEYPFMSAFGGFPSPQLGQNFQNSFLLNNIASFPGLSG